MTKKILKVKGVLPDCNPFKIQARHIVGKENISLYLVTGELKNIQAYASVNDDVVQIMTLQEAKDLVNSWKLPTTAICPHCGQEYKIPPIDLDNL